MVEKDTLITQQNRFEDKKSPKIIIFGFGILFLVLGIILLLSSIPGSIALHYSNDHYARHQIINFLSYMLKCGIFLGLALIIAAFFFHYFLTIKRFLLNLFTDKKLILSVTVCIISFGICDPLFFLDFKKEVFVFLTDANFMGKNDLFVGVDSLGFWGNLWWYIKGPINWGIGLHFEIMALFGFICTLCQLKKVDIPIIVFLLTYLMLIGAGNFRWERYAILLMPFTAMYAAYFLNNSVERLFSKRISANATNGLIFCFAIIMIVNPIYNILRYDYLLTQKDTRVMAKEWIEKNIPLNSKIGQDAYTGDLPEGLFQITRKYSLGDKPFSYYTENDYHYLLVSDTQYLRYFAEPDKHPDFVDFYDTLFAKGKLIQDIKPKDDLWPHPYNRFKKYHIHISPRIQIYQINLMG